MEKNKYYVSVQAGTILPNQGDAAYEFEIEAADEEIHKLKLLFDEKREWEEATFFRAPIPGIPYHQDKANDGYDYVLKEIYSLLGELGTQATSDHIATMDLDDIGKWQG